MDPGFPRGGGTNPPGGTPTYDFAKFPQNFHEIERICTGGDASRILLCRSATDDVVENAVHTVKMSIITITYLEFQSRYHSVTH